MFDNLKKRMARRNHYNRLIDEISRMSARDLADINGDRSDMMRAAYAEVYGA
ncbi:hypothetical protein DK058_25110, partial [Salmonella enterica subsp. enterica serovar Typhi]|nr:hypothetical protein [Salmonella enterica subsp. enterica serovar Typhi]